MKVSGIQKKKKRPTQFTIVPQSIIVFITVNALWAQFWQIIIIIISITAKVGKRFSFVYGHNFWALLHSLLNASVKSCCHKSSLNTLFSLSGWGLMEGELLPVCCVVIPALSVSLHLLSFKCVSWLPDSDLALQWRPAELPPKAEPRPPVCSFTRATHTAL